jgi:tetratricopeptide (TPR) repeat protein
MKKISWAFLIICIACNNRSDNTVLDPIPVTREAQLQEAVKQYPDSLLLRENLIQYYRESGNFVKAFDEVNSLLQKDSTNPRVWDIKATLQFEDGDTTGSIRSFEKAVEIIPLPEYIISLGSLYAQTKNPAALLMADALLSADKAKADKEAYFIKGLYHQYKKEYRQAINYFDKCLSLNHTFMDAYREKAIALYESGKFEEALKVLDRAITLQNNFDEGYYYKGLCLEKLSRTEEAKEAYEMALMYDPSYIEAKEALERLR